MNPADRPARPDGAVAEVAEGAVARSGMINGAASVLGTALAFAMTLVITNAWGVADTGVFFAAVAAFMIVATAMKLGVETALVLFISRLRSTGSISAGRRTLTVGLGPVAGASVMAGALLWLGADLVAGVFTDPTHERDFVAVLRVLAWFVPVWSVSLCLLGATRGAGTMTPTAVGLQFGQPASQLVLVALAARADASLPGLAWAWATPIGATLVWAAVAAARLLPPDSSGGGLGRQAPTRRELWGYAAPRGVAASLQMALDRVGVLLVAALASVAIAGQWAAIARLVGVAQRVFHAIGQALNPRISSLAERGAWADVARSVDRITQLTMLVLAPPLVGLAWFPRAALDLFGDDFAAAAPALRVAALVVLAASLLAHADNVLLMSGDSRQATVNTAAALVVAVLGYLLLVPGFDAVGAALAFGLGIAVYRLSAAVQIRRRHGVVVAGPLTRVAALAAVGCSSVPLAVARGVGGDSLGAAVVGAAIAVVVFGAAIASLARRDQLLLSFD